MKLIYLSIFIGCLSGYGQTEGFISCNGGKIYYRTFGAGKPLLIINGGPGMNSDGFVGLAGKLSKDNQTIIYDQRGTGKSTLDKSDSSTVTMKLMVEDLECLRKYLQIKEWIILGHSFGGMLACYYTTFYPEHVEALILSSSGGIDLELMSYVGNNVNSRLSSTETDSLHYWTTKISSGDTSYYARLQRGKWMAPAYVFDRKNSMIIAERLTQGNTQINGYVWQDLQKIKFDCKVKLLTFNKPVLIIQGKQDIVQEKTALKAHKVFKNSKMILLDKCVHYGWLDRPDEYFAEVEKFIKRS